MDIDENIREAVKKIENHWFKLMAKYSENISLQQQFLNEIIQEYSSGKRFYHNLLHIAELLDFSIQYKSEIKDIDTLQLAIYYHDFVYNIAGTDNEEKSAETAKLQLKKLGIADNKIEKCCKLITATKFHTDFIDKDTMFLQDFDLSVLGAEWSKYLQYSKNIRLEYSRFSDSQYKKGRIAILNYFLAKESIYKTVTFHNKYERISKNNIKREIDLLNSK
jgi:predicted metal-dependent HD superfamily phosphohydrolase